MNHTMDIFWNVFDTMGGMQWFISLCDTAGGYIWAAMDYILRAFRGLGK